MVELVTVSITAYNAESTIGRAIESALAQHWDAIEILVVDDCSTDATATRVDELSSRHSNLRLVRHAQNGGVAAEPSNLANRHIMVHDEGVRCCSGLTIGEACGGGPKQGG